MSTSTKSFLKALFLMAALAACASTISRPTGDRYALRITDNVADGRFDVALTSNDSRPLCVSIESWPNSSGYFTVEKEDTYVKSGADVLSANSKLMSAYCPGGCGEHRIEPQGELHGFIAYEAFGDAGRLAKDVNKELEFPVSPYYCR
ncbi:hypothetical protein [Stenotrophomonas acidaminiphila]|uniref:hypothetical protein n=1 Tax=Stenotrophomonas acidaminiphila TaxID=128780 RepID=UPI0039BD0B0A